MDKETFVREQLKVRGIPEVTPTRYKKSIFRLILYGHRNADMNSSSAAKITKKYFPNKQPKQYIFNYLVEQANKAYCPRCEQVLEKELFDKNMASKNGMQSSCKKCRNLTATHYNTLRKECVIERTPKWADLGKIEAVYLNCPKGYHVDHILPLRGETISGLHIENNLQYLTPEDNLKKSNKFESYSEDLG